MEGKEKDDAVSDAAPVPDVDSGQNVSASGSGGGIKRDLSSRHINMIAIAGMIVSRRCFSNHPIGNCSDHLTQGDWPVPQLRLGDRNCGTRGCAAGLHRDGICHRRSVLHHGRDHVLHASDWRLH